MGRFQCGFQVAFAEAVRKLQRGWLVNGVSDVVGIREETKEVFVGGMIGRAG